MKQPRNLLTQPDLGRRLAETRKRLGWTQTALQELLGLDRRVTISDWETGKESIPPERLAQIASLAGASVEGVFGDRAGTVPERARATTGAVAVPVGTAEEDERRLCRADAIEDPLLRQLEREGILAIMRVRVLGLEAQAAEQRARALRAAEVASVGRARAIGAGERAAEQRVGRLWSGKPTHTPMPGPAGQSTSNNNHERDASDSGDSSGSAGNQ
jgi:transcriptional regulator with XRE-family HTH domain